MAASVRAFYELTVRYAEVPVINTVDAVLLWAGRLATGEAQRIAAGGPALAWPAIGEVNAVATTLQTAANAQSTAKDAFDLAQESVSDQRPTVDPVIKDLWDTIECNLRAEESSSLRRKAREWGVVYNGEDEEAEPPVSRRRPRLERRGNAAVVPPGWRQAGWAGYAGFCGDSRLAKPSLANLRRTGVTIVEMKPARPNLAVLDQANVWPNVC